MESMHEASIVRNIIEIAEREAHRHGASAISRIKIRIGEFRGVVGEALEFSFEVLKAGTLAAGACLEVETVPLRMSCRSCGEYNCVLSELSFNCPTCGEAVLVTGGRELEVEYLELD